MELNRYMRMALDEARISLREGNHGFGAVIIKDGQVVSTAHDTENDQSDPTSHAEMNAIKAASQRLGRDLTGCIMIATHEPCPMCATAIVWSKISHIAYGYSIKEAMAQGRKRIALHCRELFEKAQAEIKTEAGVLNDECSILYRADVRAELKKLRGADDDKLCRLNAESTQKRVKWFHENRNDFQFIDRQDILNSGYQLLLAKFGISEEQAPIIKKSDREIVFHSQNFCPTLEACKILGIDTRILCRKMNEKSTDTLIKQLDPRLSFSRNYERLRPYTAYCEEMIFINA
ncbi:tRNA(Arg) A34 adenosine deaminase TadA [Hydrogenispora ethanolica]|jgi:tRNA(Arg) A34 adenosine deaminase TadA|uniref:tRNA(Arg) A34 adenosine deaminase TadA n=1 Tax=Hydrogenispora ethanolica TaxID=1082276 RepID=A0A4R1QQP6_HYDET|nr:nucleoside deaminase [Hydrogenispora ethanolica]TCL56156.1 tRNA(Arg) A34 adenosine deaminase TadA [Hydrogenispora ethanolica]